MPHLPPTWVGVDNPAKAILSSRARDLYHQYQHDILPAFGETFPSTFTANARRRPPVSRTLQTDESFVSGEHIDLFDKHLSCVGRDKVSLCASARSEPSLCREMFRDSSILGRLCRFFGSLRFWGFDTSPPFRPIAFLILLYFIFYAISPLVVAIKAETQVHAAPQLIGLRLSYVEHFCASLKATTHDDIKKTGKRVVVKKKKALPRGSSRLKFNRGQVIFTQSNSIAEKLDPKAYYSIVASLDLHDATIKSHGFGRSDSDRAPPLS